MHLAPHTWGVAGLLANMGAALLLLFFTPDLKGYRPDGSNVGGTFFVAPSPEGKRQYRIRHHGYRLGLELLIFGFFLQLVDLLKS